MIFAKLTKRQREVVKLVTQGLSNKEIGQRLTLTEGTVKIHLHAIYLRLRVPNRTALALLAARPPRGQRRVKGSLIPG